MISEKERGGDCMCKWVGEKHSERKDGVRTREFTNVKRVGNERASREEQHQPMSGPARMCERYAI